MRQLDALANTLAAVCYFNFFALVLYDLRRPGPARWAAPLTLSLAAVFVTSALHHSALAVDLWRGADDGHLLDVIVVAMLGLFAGIWLFLRYEAQVGGRGDRVISRPSPGWLFALGIYGVIVLSGAVALLTEATIKWGVLSNYGIFVAYMMIAWRLFAGQFLKDRSKWSLSGVVMAGYFAHCALSRLVFASFVALEGGGYKGGWYYGLFDWLSLAAAIAFMYLAERQSNLVLQGQD